MCIATPANTIPSANIALLASRFKRLRYLHKDICISKGCETMLILVRQDIGIGNSRTICDHAHCSTCHLPSHQANRRFASIRTAVCQEACDRSLECHHSISRFASSAGDSVSSTATKGPLRFQCFIAKATWAASHRVNSSSWPAARMAGSVASGIRIGASVEASLRNNSSDFCSSCTSSQPKRMTSGSSGLALVNTASIRTKSRSGCALPNPPRIGCRAITVPVSYTHLTLPTIYSV